MNIDGKNLILGRVATVAAKAALLGEEVKIFNCKYMIITGSKSWLIQEYLDRLHRGTHTTGPYQPKMPYKFVKRAIRGMLPYKKSKGQEAFKRILCYDTIPEEFKDLKLVTIDDANIDNSRMSKYMSIKQICNALGGKVE